MKHIMSGTPVDRKEVIPPKPRRPLTCYGIFSVLERNFIWQEDNSMIPSNVSQDRGVDPYAATRPERYRDLVLPSNWFVVGMNRKKRAKRNDHRVIPFKDLTKTIAERWRSVSPEIKAYCEIIANDELERYLRDIVAYKEKYGKDAVKARVNKKRKSRKAQVGKCYNSAEDSDSSGTGNNCDDEYNDESSDSEVSGMSSNAMQVECGHRLSDYLSDDRSEALELVGYNYNNILSGKELLKAFDDDDDDESDGESMKDHSSRNDSSTTSQAFSLFEVNEMLGQPSASARQQDQSNLPSTSSAVSALNGTISPASPPAPDPLKTIFMYRAFQQWCNGGRSS
ncbi:hypothetical protein ACHAW6_015161 [Cyclotella cf. meneghiniana]